MSSSTNTVICSALNKSYQQRTNKEHRALCQAIAPLFPTLSANKIQLITFYLQVQKGPISPENYSPHSYLIIFSSQSNPQKRISMTTLRNKSIAVSSDQLVAILDFQKYLNVDLLGQTTIEKQLSFWEGSQYFCSMPRKKFYQLIRFAKVLTFNENQYPYIQGQQITQKQSGSGVYVVRSGEFGYFHSQVKQIETSKFGEGHIFGALELLGRNGNEVKQRVMTVKCKTAHAIVYHFSQGIFNQWIRRYCESVIHQKQAKLQKFLPNSQRNLSKTKSFSYSDNLQQTKMSNSIASSFFKSKMQFRPKQQTQKQQQIEKRAFPAIKLQQIHQTASTSFYKSMGSTSKIQNSCIATSSLSLKKDGPLKNYPLVAQRSNFTTSQFRDLDVLFAKRKNENQNIQKKANQGQNKVWKRDMLHSFYRQNFYNSVTRNQFYQ